MKKIKLIKNDLVQITVGKDKGKQGKIEKVLAKSGQVFIPGLNQFKKHRKPMGDGRPGEILTVSKPLLVSKVSLVCPKCKQVTRVGIKTDKDKKVRYCRKCDQNI